MKHLSLAFILTLLCAISAHSQAVEVSGGLSSPNKGLVGVRYSPMPYWSFGPLLGSFANYTDIGISGSFHFIGYSGFYVFSSHHLLLSDKGPAKTVWEIDTGGGFQYVWDLGILAYVELGVPVYIGGGQVWRHYESGRTYNRAFEGDIVLVAFRAGLGLGYKFSL